MFVIEYPADTFAEIAPNAASITVHRNGQPDSYWPRDILSTMSAEGLADLGIYHVDDFVPPAGYRTVGAASYSRVDGVIVQSYEVELIPVPVPQEITRRQLILALNQLGFITSQEAIDAARGGEVPAFIASYFDAMPEPQRTTALVTWASMSVCLRTDPLFTALSSATGLTDAQIDDYFRLASTL